MSSITHRVLLSALALSAAAHVQAAPRRYVEGEVIVKFKQPVAASRMGAAARAGHAGATIARHMVDPVTGVPDGRVALSRFPKTTSVETMMARLRRLPDVAAVEPNYVVSLSLPKVRHLSTERATVTRRVGIDANGKLVTRQVAAADIKSQVATYPNDPTQLAQWGWTWVNADVVWPDVRSAEVAVLDTGIDAQHPDLLGRVVNGYDYVNDDLLANDDNGHGTHVAGILAARPNNKTGIAGVSRSRIYAIKVLDAAGFGTYFDIAQGIRKAASRLSVRVINISLGGTDVSFTLEDAVAEAVGKGKLIVAAAGNDFDEGPFYPAAYSELFPESVVAVAASGRTVTGSLDNQEYFLEDCRADYSNFGSYVTITAPGTDIYSTQPWKKDFYNHRYFDADPDFTGYEFYSGTSMAAPHVSGVAARLFGVNPKTTAVDVFRKMLFQGYSSRVGELIDVDNDGTPEMSECWDSGFTPPTPVGVTPFLADVNAATALGRGRVTGRLMDASTGLGLHGATASLLKGTGTGKVGYGGTIDTVGSSFFDVINVPWSQQTDGGPFTAPYRMRVSKLGYGTPVVEDYAAGDPQKPGISIGYFEVETRLRQVSVPPISPSYVFVSDWGTWNDCCFGYGTEVQLDQYLFLPLQLLPPGDFGCTVGFDDFTFGGCGDPGPTGSLQVYPFARWMRDGGGSDVDGLGSETTNIRRLLPTQMGNEYHLLLTDYSEGELFLEPDAFPVVRLWKGGLVKATVRFDPAVTAIDPDCVPAGGVSPCEWWDVGRLRSTGVFERANLLPLAADFPYSAGGPSGASSSTVASSVGRARRRTRTGGAVGPWPAAGTTGGSTSSR
jgi:subtilisin family serine protease